MSVSSCDYVKFEILSPGGPSLAHHAGCIINKCLYVHGGINYPGSKIPLNGLYEYSTSSGIWSDLTSHESPALSYHACVSLSDHYFILIGGWNGKLRTSDVNVFDVNARKWLDCKTSGFPQGSGLSSHTASLLTGGDILVIGREGFLRTQRRFASVFRLSCRISDRSFKYTRLETTVGSRSGHTCNLVDSKIFIIGGRKDNLLETLGFATPGAHQSSSVTFKVQNEPDKPLKIIPRNYHATAICNSGTGILLHGGWAFDGKHKEPLSECYMLSCKSPLTKWTFLGDSRVHLSGHVMCEHEDTILVHGGENNKVNCTLYHISPNY